MSGEALLFDSHCHLDDPRFDEDREELIQSLPGEGVCACLSVACDIPTTRLTIEIAERYPFVYATAGIHPHDAGKAGAEDLAVLPSLLEHEKVVALGEIGLDYHYDFSPRDVQREVFLAQLDLAYEMKKPVIFHVRESHGDMLTLLENRKGRLPGGVMHSFSGSAESAKQYLNMGFYISFSGSVTFKNAEKVRRAAQAVPLERLLIETDSPYLTPAPFRGKRNNPALVRHVCAQLAELFEMPWEEMARVTRDNARALFGL